MPFIQITLGTGRSDEQKRDLVLDVSQAAAHAIGVDESSVRVWIVEVPSTSIAAGGEILAERLARANGASAPPPAGTSA